MLWKDTYSLTKKLQGVYPVAAAMSSIFFLVGLLFILLGLAASTFARSAPHVMALAGNGGLWSVWFIIVAAHFEMMDILPMVLLAISCVIFLSIFTTYWYFCARDLEVSWFCVNFLLLLLRVAPKTNSGCADSSHDCEVPIQDPLYGMVLLHGHLQVRTCNSWYLVSNTTPPSQITMHFGFSRYIIFAMYLDVVCI